MLNEGRLYNVHGFNSYGAGSNQIKAIKTWEQVMYVHDESTRNGEMSVFLSEKDQDQSFETYLLTRLKIPKGKFHLIERDVMSPHILRSSLIINGPGEHSERIDKFLRKAESLAENLPFGQKREMYLEGIRMELYEQYEERLKDRIITVTKRDPMVRKLVREVSGYNPN